MLCGNWSLPFTTMDANISVRPASNEAHLPQGGHDWVEDTDVVDVSLDDRVHIVERVAELHARRVQAGLLSLPVFARSR